MGAPEIGVAVLTGGASSRMGRPKALLLTPDGETFAARLCRELAFFPRRYLSLGGSLALAAPGFVAVTDDLPGRGPLGALAAVLRRAETDAVLVVACDMPYYGAAEARALAAAYRGEDALTAVCAGRRQPLASIYSKRLLPAAEKALAAGRLRVGALAAEAALAREFAAADPRAYVNLNTPEEYRDYLAGRL